MTTLTQIIKDTKEERQAAVTRLADADEIIRRYVATAFPKSIEAFYPTDVSGMSRMYQTPNLDPRAATVLITFRRHALEAEASAEEEAAAAGAAYGTIVKVAEGLSKAGWLMDPQPSLEAQSWKSGMDVRISGVRVLPARRRRKNHDSDPEREVRISVTFEAMPETAHCRIIETTEYVAAHTAKVRRVECGEGGPTALLKGAVVKEKVS